MFFSLVVTHQGMYTISALLSAVLGVASAVVVVSVTIVAWVGVRRS